jgi:hypothetical protein
VGKPKPYSKGDTVTWKWGQGTAEGKVADSFTERVTRQIEGKEITRNADEENPATSSSRTMARARSSRTPS